MRTPDRPAGPADGPALILRLAIGPMVVTHGWNKLFGKGGLQGTTNWFRKLGLEPAKVHALLAATTEIVSGSLLTLGAASPAPAAAVVGLMLTATRTDHRGKGFFVFKGGWEYTGVVAVVASAMAALGPGRYSLDAALGRGRSGLRWGLLSAAAGAAASTALLAASYREPPPATAGPGSPGG